MFSKCSVSETSVFFSTSMANLSRFPKSGSDWNLNDLDAYHIELKRQDPLTFFGLSALPDPQLDEVGAELFQTVEAEHMVDHRNAELIHLLDLSVLHHAGESAVADFAVELFKRLGYVRRHRVARTRKDMQLLICGEYRRIKADVCIMDRSSWGEIDLLVQEDRRLDDDEGSCPQAKLIAAAMAAFCENNMNREVAGLTDLSNTVRSMFSLFFALLINGIVGDPRHYISWILAYIFQDSHYQRPHYSLPSWHVPTSTLCGNVLSPPTCTRENQRRDETLGKQAANFGVLRSFQRCCRI